MSHLLRKKAQNSLESLVKCEYCDVKLDVKMKLSPFYNNL